MTQAASSLPQVKLKTDASSHCRAKQYACVTEARTDAREQLDVTLVVGGGGVTVVYCEALLGLLCVPPVSLHPLRVHKSLTRWSPQQGAGHTCSHCPYLVWLLQIIWIIHKTGVLDFLSTLGAFWQMTGRQLKNHRIPAPLLF